MNAAVIIETRKLPNLAAIIDRHFKHLPDDYELVFFCGKDNKDHVNEAINLSEGFSRAVIKQINLSQLNRVFYNQLITDPKFWHYLSKYPRVLVFQHDSGLLRSGIEEFYKWDYVGAPWEFQENGGNGGLSLRNPVIMERICLQFPYHPGYGNEDVYFSNKVSHVGGTLAPREACEKFSVECIYKLGTLGYHAIERYHGATKVEQIKNQYNECRV